MASELLADDTRADAPRVAEPSPVRLWRGRRPAPIAGVTVAALAFYLYHAFADQARFLTTGYDLGIFDQAIRAYSHFQAPMVPLKGAGYNIFGDHFHPIIAVLAPLYWLWNDLGVLLIAQAVLTAGSIVVVYRFTRRRAGEGFSLLVAAAYGFGWPLQALIDFDFHEVAFATPLAALAIDALDRRDDRRLVLWAALLLLVREDMGLLVALLALLRLAQRRPRPRLVAGLLTAGFAMYVLTTVVIIPHFAAGHAFAYGDQFAALGDSVPSAAFAIVAHPLHALNVFFTPVAKTKTLLYLILPLALLPLGSRYALLALPLLAERFFNSRDNLWLPLFHYNALPWLILVLAMVDGADRAGLFRGEPASVRARRLLGGWLVAVPLLLIVVGSALGVVPVTSLRGAYSDQPANWSQSAQTIVDWLPHDVCVAADNHVVPHLTARDWTTIAEADTPDPDFYVLDMIAPDTGGNPPAPTPREVYDEVQAEGYSVVFTAGTFEILQSPFYSGPSAQCAPLGPGHPG